MEGKCPVSPYAPDGARNSFPGEGRGWRRIPAWTGWRIECNFRVAVDLSSEAIRKHDGKQLNLILSSHGETARGRNHR